MIIITLLIRGCYSGFGRGLLTELLSLAGAVCITSLTLNYAGTVSAWLEQWGWLTPQVTALAGFWGLFLALMTAVHYVARRVTEVVKWERLHWMVQGIGLVLGGVRALWWTGFLLVVLVSSGFLFLRQSVEERSVFGPRLLGISRQGLARAADVFPGAAGRSDELVPRMKPSDR
ncbi:MAG: CvpA family protein [Candidatus Omnitrophica bacterium]|nr:CvpA family protein [Candidatus Omnitrophota bacterium]